MPKISLPSLPLSGESWTVLFALAVVLVVAGRAYRSYRRNLAPAADSAVAGDDWKTSLASSAVGVGWALLLAVVALFCAGEGFVEGGLHF